MNYTITHLHSDVGNNGFIDSTTKFKRYIEKAIENDMKAIAFTEHGCVLSWVAKKQYCDSKGIKYIHGQEFYVTETLEQNVRDNYHVCLYALNWEGVKELNKLSSLGFQQKYYDPRITLEQLMGISKNIALSTACLGGLLFKGNDNVRDKFLTFIFNNKERCFLEIQHHIDKEQIEYNKYLYSISKNEGCNLIVGTDTHALDASHASARTILQKSKKISFDNETAWDLTFKTYEELIECYRKQNSLPMDIVELAIANTNKLADMVEEFELDESHKYPKLHDDSESLFINLVYKGLNDKGFTNNQEYIKRIEHEITTYKKNGAIDYMLLQKDIIDWCHQNDIWQGYSRGSVSGSLCAYLLGITDMDSIKWNLNFERFMSPERISLADIDTDFPPNKRESVKEYIFNKNGLYCSEIVTFNTIALKGAIRDVGRALEIDLKIVDEISKNIEGDEDKYRKQYPELFKYVDLCSGVITSVGSHPCGFVVSDITIDDNMGLFTTSSSNYVISQVNMKEIDSLNFVKLDILGLDNVQIINEACKLANIERLTPDNVDFNDVKVWNSIAESNLGIFQWESDFANSIYKRLFDPKIIENIKANNNNFSYIDLFSMGNGALRPAGESYRDQMCEGEFRDNGHKALNEFLSPTMGFLVYQEQIIEFLNKFCGYTLGEADLVRRGFAKKTGTEEHIPRIKLGFISTMKEKYNVGEEESEKLIESFLQVIQDASDYLFSLNHSQAYSAIGYICAYLRYYYPIEFLTVILNINESNIDKTKDIVEYAKLRNIKIKPVKFRYSKGRYFYNKENNEIYKGIGSIKYCNENIGKELFSLRDNKYETFVDLLVNIADNTALNSRQIETLIKLNYFSEFGGNAKLLDIYGVFGEGKIKYSKTYKEKTKIARIAELKNYEEGCIDGVLPISEQISFEFDALGTPMTTYNLPKHIFILSVDTKNSPKLEVYGLYTGRLDVIKIDKKTYNMKKVVAGDVIIIEQHKIKPRAIYMGKDDNGKPRFELSATERDFWIEKYEVKTIK
jgi:DNA polymerase III subunit alpha